MTIAERLRLEKQNATPFDTVGFRTHIEQWFTKHGYDDYIFITSSDNIQSIEARFDQKTYCGWQADEILIPSAHFAGAIAILQAEGFHVYRATECYCVSLRLTPVIRHMNTYFHPISK